MLQAPLVVQHEKIKKRVTLDHFPIWGMNTSNKKCLSCHQAKRAPKIEPAKNLFKKIKKIGLSISLRLATTGRGFRILLRYTRHCARCHTRYRLWLRRFGWPFGDDTRGQGLETIPGVESHCHPPRKTPWEGRTVCSPIDLSILSYKSTNM